VVIIKAQEYRSQEMNREAAIARLVALIQELTAVQKSPGDATDQASKERRLASKAQNPQSRRCVESSSVKAWRTGGMDNKEFTVKKIVFSVVAACSLFALFGCNHRAEMDTLQPAPMEELKPMQQSWRGVLPCADCEGIETSLFLEKDGTWVMNERYQGVSREPSSFASYGTWARTADKLVLTDSKGEKSYYRAKGDKLEMLDRDGNPIESTLNYTLESVKPACPSRQWRCAECTSIWRMPRPLPIAQPASEWQSRTTRSSSVIMPRRAERILARCCWWSRGTLRWKRIRIRERRLKFWRWIHQASFIKKTAILVS
jgi:uncharacterized lipoprotein NlpE involved in copper resistance